MCGLAGSWQETRKGPDPPGAGTVTNMAGVAILGYGVVGAGTARLLTTGREPMRGRTGLDLELRRIVDVRQFPDDPLASLMTSDFSDVLADPEIRVVVETIGGIGVALKFTRLALTSGRHVVTSNKELVATHGPELMELAAESDVQYLFEASVGGGIPIIHPMRVCLAANEIRGVSGILNGTTNYILTRMELAGIPFATALKEAQEHGFAEQNPEADVEGTDACRKLAILSSIAYGGFVAWKDIHTEGISQVDADLIDIASSACAQVKLVARSHRTSDGRIAASVSPAALSRTHPVACASGVNNAIAVVGDSLGTVLFYGPGAGALPTASAVVSDILECLEHGKADRRHVWPSLPDHAMLPFAEHPVRILAHLKPDGSTGMHVRFAKHGVRCRAFGTQDDVLLCGGDDTLTEGILDQILAASRTETAAGTFRWIRYIG